MVYMISYFFNNDYIGYLWSIKDMVKFCKVWYREKGFWCQGDLSLNFDFEIFWLYECWINYRIIEL